MPFNEVKKKEKIKTKYLKFNSNKKILIFGPSSDVAKRLNKIFKHKFLIYNHSFKIDFENPIIKKIEFLKMEKKIKKIMPNECYLTAKRKGEELCKSSKFNKIAFFYRLPQLISRSNYNILGYYEGKDLKVLDSYFKRFIK